MSIAAVGNLNLDIYIRASELPKRDEAVEVSDFYMGGGGSAANFSVAIRRLGLSSRFIGSVGRDLVGDLLLEELAKEGVDVNYVKRVEGVGTGVVVVIVGANGEKRMLAYRGANLALSPHDMNEESLRGACHLHIASGRLELIRRGVGLAERLGITVSVDGGSSLARKGLEVLSSSLRGVHVVFLNLAEARMLTGVEDPALAGRKLIDKLDANEVVITLGDRGALAFSKGEIHYADAFKVTPIDTTGAGDSFAAAYVSSMIKGLPLPSRLVFANAVASLKVVRKGARGSPRLDEVLEFLKSMGQDLAI